MEERANGTWLHCDAKQYQEHAGYKRHHDCPGNTLRSLQN